ncbi:MAG: biotin/lipoyl-containing protein [Chloroflexota bacterium]
MKYSVTVAGKTYQVEIENLNARPILAKVDGEVFEVSPEESRPEGSGEKPSAAKNPIKTEAGPGSGLSGNTLFAPLPGNVTEVFVKAGEQVETGQVVLVIEAMKMKNSIRSTRGGKVAEVLVSAGQTVAHRQALINFADAGEASWM